MDSFIKFVEENPTLSITLGFTFCVAFVVCVTVVVKISLISNKNNTIAGRDAYVVKGNGNEIEKGSR